MTALTHNVKTGWRTTEFWITVATAVGMIGVSCAGVLPPKWAAVCTTASVVAYKISRGLTKLGAGTQ